MRHKHRIVTRHALQLDDDGSTAAVDRARRAGVLVEHGEDLRFTHPLFASAVESTATPNELRTAHHKLAAVVPDEEGRARHLALSTDRPDAEVAASLESAAARTQARGAPDAAAELMDLARSLTPAGHVDDLRPDETLAYSFQARALYPVRAQAVSSQVYAYYRPEWRGESLGGQLVVGQR